MKNYSNCIPKRSTDPPVYPLDGDGDTIGGDHGFLDIMADIMNLMNHINMFEKKKVPEKYVNTKFINSNCTASHFLLLFPIKNGHKYHTLGLTIPLTLFVILTPHDALLRSLTFCMESQDWPNGQ